MVTRCIYKQFLKDLSEIDRKRGSSPGGMPALPPVGSVMARLSSGGLIEVFEMSQIGVRGRSVVLPPKLDMVGGLVGGAVERCHCRLQDDSLGPDQGEGGLPASVQEGDLQLEFDPHVSDVLDRLAEPAFELPLSAWGDAMNDSFRAGFAWFGVDGCGQAEFHEAVEGAIGERSAHSQNSSDWSFGGECFGDRKPMGRVFGEDSEDGVLG